MNNKAIVKLTNKIGLISIILLVYWVFGFISMEVFKFKIFKENMTQTFYLSIVGILSLMAGSLILNIMFNLTRIAEKHNVDIDTKINKKNKAIGIAFILSFPLLFILLIGGDFLSSMKKKDLFVKSAQSIFAEKNEKIDALFKYRFDKYWIVETVNTLNFYSNFDKNYSKLSLIIEDTLYNSKVFLEFNYYHGIDNDTIIPYRSNYRLKTSEEEREYLIKIFKTKSTEIRFSSYNGNYELFYPAIRNGKVIILYFSDYLSYGKMGS